MLRTCGCSIVAGNEYQTTWRTSKYISQGRLIRDYLRYHDGFKPGNGGSGYQTSSNWWYSEEFIFKVKESGGEIRNSWIVIALLKVAPSCSGGATCLW